MLKMVKEIIAITNVIVKNSFFISIGLRLFQHITNYIIMIFDLIGALDFIIAQTFIIVKFLQVNA